MKSLPTLVSNPQPPTWQPQPSRVLYCVCCSHILGEKEGPLVCNRCAGIEGLRICHCNICGKPLAIGHGASSAHDECIRRRYALVL